jgi:hypothetical protein
VMGRRKQIKEKEKKRKRERGKRGWVVLSFLSHHVLPFFFLSSLLNTNINIINK